MKLPLRSLALLASLAAAFPALAQEAIEAEEAQRIAHKLYETLGSPSDAPFTADVDPDKPKGIKAGSAGLMVLPDRKLTADALAKAGKEVTPVAQLWTLDISVATGSHPIAISQARIVRMGEGDKSKDVQLYYLGAAKDDAGELQLVIFAKDKTQPVHRVPLKKSANASQSSPIEIDGRKQEENVGVLTLHLLGEYSAEIALMKQE